MATDQHYIKPDTVETLLRVTTIPFTRAEAVIVVEKVPLRGTPEWIQREMLRQRLGYSCLGWGRL